MTRLLALLTLTTVAACAQEVVSARADGAPTDASPAGPDAAAGDADPGLDAPSRADADAPTDADPRAFDATSADASVADASPRDGGALACHVDRFSSCADPTELRPNNTPADSTQISGISLGCASGDTFVPAHAERDGRICHTEPADWYEVTYLPCDTLIMVATVQLVVDAPCEDDAFELRVSGRPCDGSDPDTECMRQGSTQTVRFFIRPSNSVGSLDLGVVRVREDVASDYRLTYQLAR